MENVANTPPPAHVAVNGTEYACAVDFRVWAEIVLLAQENLYDQPKTNGQIAHNLRVLAQMQRLAFGRVIPQPAMDTLRAMLDFMKGYPRADNGWRADEDGTGTKTYSFKHDMNYIVLAIRNQSGIDLTYRRSEPFHWWLFLLEFQTLSGEHLITNIMQWRAYDGESKALIRRRNRVSLPKEYTRSEQAMLDEMACMFPNT